MSIILRSPVCLKKRQGARKYSDLEPQTPHSDDLTQRVGVPYRFELDLAYRRLQKSRQVHHRTIILAFSGNQPLLLLSGLEAGHKLRIAIEPSEPKPYQCHLSAFAPGAATTPSLHSSLSKSSSVIPDSTQHRPLHPITHQPRSARRLFETCVAAHTDDNVDCRHSIQLTPFALFTHTGLSHGPIIKYPAQNCLCVYRN